ncbi:MAG: hypothetical protein ACT4QC_08845 [Planctomycetaceae bacterium]
MKPGVRRPAAQPVDQAQRTLPPKVVKKKKAAQIVDGTPRPVQPGTPASEFLAPLVLVIAGLAITVGTSLLLKPDGISTGAWLAVRMGMIVASLVITYGALFVAAAVVETDYGYITTGLLKVAAIVLTQDWVGDLAGKIPIPFVGGIVAFLTTYAMFKYFFGLDDAEAIASMFVVRIVNFLVMVVLLAAVIGALFSGVELPDVWSWGNDAAAVDIEGADEDADGWEMKEIEIDPGGGMPNLME